MPHLNGYACDGAASSLLEGDATAVNRRTAVLFRKSKAAGPHKPPRDGDRATDGGNEGPKEGEDADEGQLASKSFLSVVIPRLETLLHKRKRKHNGGGGSEGEEEEEDEAPVKRLNTGEGRGARTFDSLPVSVCVQGLFSMSPLRPVQGLPGWGRGERAFQESQQSRTSCGAAKALRLRVVHLLQQQPAGKHQVLKETSCFWKIWSKLELNPSNQQQS